MKFKNKLYLVTKRNDSKWNVPGIMKFLYNIWHINEVALCRYVIKPLGNSASTGFTMSMVRFCRWEVEAGIWLSICTRDPNPDPKTNPTA